MVVKPARFLPAHYRHIKNHAILNNFNEIRHLAINHFGLGRQLLDRIFFLIAQHDARGLKDIDQTSDNSLKHCHHPGRIDLHHQHIAIAIDD